MITLEEALRKFGQMHPEVVFIVNSERNISAISKLSQKYGVDLNAPLLLLVVGGLSYEDFLSYLIQEKGLDKEKAIPCEKEFFAEVVKPLEKRISFLNADPNKNMAVNDEKDMLRRIFAGGVLEELAENFIIRNAVNLRIFNILRKDINFKSELIRLLFQNEEQLTQKNIILENKQSAPTIANWLKDFIEKKGTGVLSTIELSDYIANGNNCRNISEAEKIKLFDILNIYTNLKNYPDQLIDLAEDKWEIIPRGEIKRKNNYVAPKETVNTKKNHLSKEQIKDMTEIEKMIAKQEYGMSDQEWDKLLAS